MQITAGKAGAWVCGVVCSDKNPLFEDENDNAVPDDFESEALDRLLKKYGGQLQMSALRREWNEERRSRPASEFVITTPLPDSFPDDCDPQGEFVHGMDGGLKFGREKNN
jgi:hypothetical protein